MHISNSRFLLDTNHQFYIMNSEMLMSNLKYTEFLNKSEHNHS